MPKSSFSLCLIRSNREFFRFELHWKTCGKATELGGALTISLDLYYSKYGKFEMTITQPLDRAIQTFIAALAYDTARENENVP